MHAAVQKAASKPEFAGAIICERGTCVGPERLVMDVRNLIQLRSKHSLVALDATHAAQIPAQRVDVGMGSGGDRYAVEAIARAGVAVGIDCLFMEVHPDPRVAPVDTNVQWPLNDFPRLLKELVSIGNAASSWRNPVPQ